MLEAFKSNTTPVNCLRLMVTTKAQDSCRKTMREIVARSKSCGPREYHSVEELTENFVETYNKNILRFLDGDFEFVMNKCRQIKESLGWSSTFMKCGLALLLLLLLKDDNLKQGCKSMAGNTRYYMNFGAGTYFKGTRHAQEYGKNQTVSPDELEIFWQCFTSWKSEFPVTDERATQYLTELEKIIDKRVRAIVSGQYRAHYSSVAALAAALGEVKESRGERFAKEEILQRYRDAFPRHSSFRSALKEYGLKDTRKK